MHSIKAVLFDLDDTLTDRGLSIDHFTSELITSYGSKLATKDQSVISQVIRRFDDGGRIPREDLCRRIVETLDWHEPGVQELVAFWKERFPECTVARADAEATLTMLRNRGYRLAIVSNGTVGAQQPKIDSLNFRRFFSSIVISESVGVRKPDPWIFRIALDALGVSPCEALFVGDHPEHDVAGARACGMHALLLNGSPVDDPMAISGIAQVIGRIETSFQKREC